MVIKFIVPRIALLLAILIAFAAPTLASAQQNEPQLVEISAGYPVYYPNGQSVLNANGQPVLTPNPFRTTAINLNNGFWSYTESDGDTWLVPSAAITIITVNPAATAQPTPRATATPAGSGTGGGQGLQLPTSAGLLSPWPFVAGIFIVGALVVTEAKSQKSDDPLVAQESKTLVWTAVLGPLVPIGLFLLATLGDSTRFCVPMIQICYASNGFLTIAFGVGAGIAQLVILYQIWSKGQPDYRSAASADEFVHPNLAAAQAWVASNRLTYQPSGEPTRVGDQYKLWAYKLSTRHRRDRSPLVLTLLISWGLAKLAGTFLGGAITSAGFGGLDLSDLYLFGALAVSGYETWQEMPGWALAKFMGVSLGIFLLWSTVLPPALGLWLPQILVARLENRAPLQYGISDGIILTLVAAMVGLTAFGANWLLNANWPVAIEVMQRIIRLFTG